MDETSKISRRTFTAGLALLLPGRAHAAPSIAAALATCPTSEHLLSSEMQHDFRLFRSGLHELEWARKLVSFDDGASLLRTRYPSPKSNELNLLWNAIGYCFKQNERLLLSPSENAHDLAVQFWAMDQFFGASPLPDTGWMMIHYPEYREQMDRIGKPYGRAVNPVWDRSYNRFLSSPDHLTLAVRARWDGGPCTLAI